MVVQHNLQAMNANRMLNVTTSSQAKSTEKLSSGYKINRAADDAAGLSISEKMRKQIRGLDQASSNAQDGISAVQTAEGALTEVHSMLQRMNELAVQAANGTNSEDDRQSIQDEIDQLTTEIDRVAETTKFNETYLLKGGKNTETKTLAAHDAGIEGTFVDAGGAKASLSVKLETGKSISIAGQNYNIIKGGNADEAEDSLTKLQADVKAITAADKKISINGTEYTSKTDASSGKLVFDAGTGTTYSAEELAGKIKDGTSVTTAAAGGTTTTVTARDYANTSTNITAEEAADKIQQALTQANNIGATKDKAKVDFTSQAKAVLGMDDKEATFKAKGAMVAFDADTNTLTSIADKDDITEFVKNSNVTLYKAASNINLDTSDKALSGILVTHDDAVASGVALKFAAGDSVTGTGVTVAGHVATPSTNYKIYEQINLVADTNTNAAHEAYAKLNDDATTKTSFDLKFEGLGDDPATAAKMVEGQNALKAEIGNISYTHDGTAGAFSHNFTAGSKLDIDKNGIVSYDGTKIATITAGVQAGQAAQAAGTATLALNGTFTDAVYKEKDTSDTYTFEITKGTTEVAEDLTLNLHVGSDADMTNKISVGVASMNSAGLGISGINVADDSGIAATYAVDAIEDAIKTVSAQRSSLGAVQNRLEHTIANLDNVVENTTSAESAIRDTDMAEEMVEYSKNNILAQAGQSMLAQANQSNQGVLSLLG